ncbi:rod shape-determining protein RodA [Mesoterricola silvestris]|uniref:Rod shape-determining protein RodA n=1 Tax=Mesoterricola silvestris TaxID=2927979 RepID=A0AA48KAU4_9BACT|nr:rod shape-determining protein RodA [Mesoterricola silvestris]BDU74435.1 rod shape-determining protein RodA [Mesoterricola silvestris]
MRERLRALDTALLWPMVLLVIMGTLTVYSAGRGTVQSTLWAKQTVWNLMGFAVMAFLASLNPKRILRSGFPLYVVGILFLALVLVAGRKIGGSQRWIVLAGLTFQPSELMKWLTLLFVAHRLGTRQPQDLTARDLAGVSALVFFPMLLVLKQPDLGMAVSFLPILVLIPILKGLRAKWVALTLVLMTLGGVVGWQKALKPYQKQRILTFLDPGADLKGKGYQINQSRIAIGAGGLTGQGFTSGSQTQLNFLPVKTTDFVFSVWAEERGFLGVLLALGLFGLVLTRILDTAVAAKSASETYFCVGAAGIIALHLLVNVGMVIGVLPNKGIVLPFFSAGGSSTLSYFLGLGVVMAVRHRAQIK